MTGETKRYLASDLSVELALPRSTHFYYPPADSERLREAFIGFLRKV